MKPGNDATELYFLAKEDCESCAGLAGLGIGHRVCCFLAQQTIEKSFKAVLMHRAITYPYSHDLLELEALLKAHRIAVPITSEELDMLSPFAVELRYCLPEIELPDTGKVLALAQQTLTWCQEILYAD